MKLFVILSLVGCALSFPRAYEPIEVDYHGQQGIPMATYLRNAEAAADFDGARIVGGTPARLGAHPHIAGLLISLRQGGTSMCGSSLLSNTKLITAAHCWTTTNFQGQSMIVVLGSLRLFSGGTRITTTNVQLHGNYNTRNLNNDIAIITINRVNYNNNINAIALPSGLLEYLTYVGNRATAVGYGRLRDGDSNNNDVLHQVSLIVIENFVCTDIYGPSTIIDSTLCTDTQGRIGTCQGDSGGPLDFAFQNVRYLIGVTSFTSQRGCQAGLPAGFARVTSFLQWIRARL
ncbi:collagenase-like [Pieris brassicae]|uniref:collagenase-like n=1 Tax=Pieris brassicae TaxID=7116 RepID=UPI001E65F21D|nr:collagenase-like [Pieris brassicae]